MAGDPSVLDLVPNPSVASARKVKLMCRFGGQIIRLPTYVHLQYVSGEIRGFTFRRDVSLAEISAKFDEVLGQPAAIRYWPPGVHLDDLVSVSTPADLDKMMDECDKLAQSSSPKLHVYLFTPYDVAAASPNYKPTPLDMKFATQYVEFMERMELELNPRSKSRAESRADQGGRREVDELASCAAVDPSELTELMENEVFLHEGQDCLCLCLICDKQTNHGILHCPYMVFAVQHDAFKYKPPARLRFGYYSKRGKSVGFAKKLSSDYEESAEENEAAALRLEEEGMNLVRITNIPENSREPKQLFDAFGGVECVTHVVVFDEEGFGFVNFGSKEDAIKAIKEIYDYGKLMCATQRPQLGV